MGRYRVETFKMVSCSFVILLLGISYAAAEADSNGADKAAVPCPSGFFCDKCPVGTIVKKISGNNFNQQICEPCPPGKYCDVEGALSPTGFCEMGHFCALGASTATPTDGVTGNICPEAHFCIGGAKFPRPCPFGSKNLNTKGLKDESECGLPHQICPMGFSCEICKSGHYCPDATSETPCPAGTFNTLRGKEALEDCLTCPAGKYCTEAAERALDCFEGYFCPAGSASPTDNACPAGSYCPRATAHPIKCPSGFYCPHERLTRPLQCPFGTHSFIGATACETSG